MYILNINPHTKKIKMLATILFSISLLGTSNTVYALKEDVSKPVHIDADSVLFNKSKGLAVYEGNVLIKQGSLVIKANKIEITAPKNDIQKITATGNPVSFQQTMDDGKPAKGKANQFVYLVKDKRIIMDGNAKLSQNNDNFSSNHIEYSIRDGELKAGNKKNHGKSRVKAIFYPSNKIK